MNAYLFLVVTALTLVAGKPEGEREKFQGTWKVSRIERNGKPEKSLFAIKISFQRDKIFAIVGTREPEPKGTFRIDPGQEPKAYDVTTPEGLLARGVYRIEGDTLTVCLSSPDDERPKTFTTKPDDGRTLIVYKREKPAKGQ